MYRFSISRFVKYTDFLVSSSSVLSFLAKRLAETAQPISIVFKSKDASSVKEEPFVVQILPSSSWMIERPENPRFDPEC
jgi:hypothetical protein